MTDYTVQVSGIATTTTDSQLYDFFTFCGKIKQIDRSKESLDVATIHFEKPSAAKTALMLNGGTLDGATLDVTSDKAYDDEETVARGDHPLEQSDKPRAGIAAEYLAKGYLLSDHILQRAIEIDHKQGISKRFTQYFHSLDSSVGERALGPDQTISSKVQTTVNAAAQQARSFDEQKGYSKIANDYYKQAITSPFGKKVFDFYTTTTKQVQDIHEEARRITEQHRAGSAPAAKEGSEGIQSDLKGQKTA